MKLKKLAIIALMSTPAFVLTACGDSEGEKQAPNNLAYVDENGVEQNLAVEKTSDKLAINNALAALSYNSSKENVQEEYKKITGVKIDSDLEIDYESTMKDEDGKVSSDFEVDGSLSGTIDFTNSQFDLTVKGSFDSSTKYSAGGMSMKESMSGSAKIQARNTSEYVFLDGSASSKVSTFGVSEKSSNNIKNYMELSNPLTDEKIDLNEYSSYIYEDDQVSLDEIYDLFDELNEYGEITISKTTEKKITFEFDALKLFNESEEFEDNQMVDYATSFLPFDLDFSLNMYISIDTETFLISDFGFECSEKIDLSDEDDYYEMTGSGKISIDFEFSLDYGNYSVDNSELDIAEYEAFEDDFDDFDFDDEFYL